MDAAREVNPSQPLSIDVWNTNSRLNKIILAVSDIVTFYNYRPKEQLVMEIIEPRKQNWPLISAESMNRPGGSGILANLEVFLQCKLGCMWWGPCYIGMANGNGALGKK